MLIAICEGKQHRCHGYINEGLVSRRAVVVIHKNDLLCSVQLHLQGTGRQFSPTGLQRLNGCLALWHELGYFSSTERPMVWIEEIRAKFVNLKFGLLNSIMLDLAEVLEDLASTMPRHVPDPVYTQPPMRAVFDLE